MKNALSFALLVLLLLTTTDTICASDSELIGLWKCYKQDHNAKVAECLYSIEFLKDGTMKQIWSTNKPEESTHKYKIKKNIITVINADDIVEWKIKYLFLKNGDIEVRMGQWNFVGVLTKNYQKVPPDYGCKFYNFYDNLK